MEEKIENRKTLLRHIKNRLIKQFTLRALSCLQIAEKFSSSLSRKVRLFY